MAFIILLHVPSGSEMLYFLSVEHYRKKMGSSKDTLHYMEQNARSDEPFTLNSHVGERLETWSKLGVILSEAQNAVFEVVYGYTVHKNRN